MKIVLQWHITEKCNFRCKHCYQNTYVDNGPSLKKMKEIFQEYIELKQNQFWDIFNQRYINFVGWEPFLRPDFIELLDYINQVTPYKLNIGILTNGSLLNSEKLLSLKKFDNLDIHFQISIEWTQEINDKIRGGGTFKKILNAIDICSHHNFPIHLSFTLTKINENELLKLVPYIERYSLKIKIRRLVPMGMGSNISKYLLTPKEWYIFSIKVQKINIQLINWYIDLTGCSEVTSHEYSGYGCAINYHRLIVINHDLEVYPCKRLEISLWNLWKISLKDAFFSQEYMKLLHIHDEIETCKKCSLFQKCKWWAKCITFAVEKTLTLPDPQCYKALLLNNQ